MSKSIASTDRISLTSGETAERDGLGWIFAFVLHAAVVVAMFVTFTHTLDVADESPPVVPVDLVTLADKTNISIKAQPKIVQPAPQPQEIQVPTPSPMPQPKAVEPAPVPTPQTEPLPTPQAKPKPAAPKVKTANQQFDEMLPGLLTPAHSGPNTADLKAILFSEIKRCWSPAQSGPHPEKLLVDYELFLNPDGTVAQPPQLAANSAAAEARDPYMQPAAEAATRAIYACAPYKLPPDQYKKWRDVTITFDPANPLGDQ